MIKSFAYASETAGPRLLIFGAVHGNEVCGPQAIQRVMTELDSGKLELVKGHVTFIPVCNPRAYAEGKRFIERNLNRYFLPTSQPQTYEDRLTNVLCPMIAVSDYFIDLHSTTAGGVPFASVEGHDVAEQQIAAAMGAEVVLFGWQEAYAACGRVNPDPAESIGTTAYARQQGAKAVLLECGQHKDLKSVDTAYDAILGVMRHIGLLKATKISQPLPTNIQTTLVIYRGEGGSFTESWGNFSQIKAGQHVATHGNGDKVVAPADGYIILPNSNTPPNTEWFYFGVKA